LHFNIENGRGGGLLPWSSGRFRTFRRLGFFGKRGFLVTIENLKILGGARPGHRVVRKGGSAKGGRGGRKNLPTDLMGGGDG